MPAESMPPAPGRAAAEDRREIEWQLAADDLAPVRRWLGAHATLDGLRIAPLPSQQLRDTYLDTNDWRVFRSGFALRVRQQGGRAEATLKSLRSARADVADRREITEALADGAAAPAQAAGPVGARLREVLAGQPLRALFTVHTLRERFAVRQTEQDDAIGEVALDETRLLGSDQEPLGELRRVEVEVRGGGPPAALAPLVEALQRSCGLTPAPENKFAAGLRATALTPPSKAQCAPAESSADIAVRDGLANQTRNTIATNKSPDT